MKILNLSFIFILSTFSLEGLHAQPGSLDKTFGNNGVVLTPFGPRDNTFYSIAIQLDKKIVAAGDTYNGSDYDFALARFDTIGELDPSFGINGIVTTNIGNFDNSATSIIIQPDQKLLLFGYAFNGLYYDFAKVRYNPDGSLDSTFGINGVVITSFGETSLSYSSVLADDGKIITAGKEGSTTISPGYSIFALCRYMPDGNLDSTFGNGGKVITSFNMDDVAFSVALRKNGKILASGYSYIGWNPSIALAQYNNDGTLDSTFGIDGKVITSIGSGSVCISMVIQEDDRIVVTGNSYDGLKSNFTLVRYNTDGSLDNSFGQAGIVTTSFGQKDSQGRSVKLQSDKKILVAGYTRAANLKYDLGLVRYLQNGKLDTTFGINGIVTTIDSNFHETLLSMAIQADGKIIAAGDFWMNDSVRNFAINRYLSGLNLGINDLQTLKNSILVYPNPVVERTTIEYFLINPSLVTVSLIDLNGKVLKTFIDNQLQESGKHLQTIILPAGLPFGPYVLVVSTTKKVFSFKIIKND